MSSWWLLPVAAMAVAAVTGAVAVRRLRSATAGVADDAATLRATGADAAALGRDVAALQARLDHRPGTDPAPGPR